VKFALLVGIALYLNPMYNLMGPENDVRNFYSMLVDTYGFQPDNVTILLNEVATKDNIIAELERLVDKAARGVHLVFYYSGHGTQVPDLDADEADTLDEAIVPHDFDWDRVQAAITDDEIKVILDRARKKGAVVDVFYDACFSGGLDRTRVVKTLPVPEKLRHFKLKEEKMGPKGAAVWTASKEDQYAYEWFFRCDADTPPELLCCEYKPECIEGVYTHYLTSVMQMNPWLSRSMATKITRSIIKRERFDQKPRLRAPYRLKYAPFSTGGFTEGGRQP